MSLDVLIEKIPTAKCRIMMPLMYLSACNTVFGGWAAGQSC